MRKIEKVKVTYQNKGEYICQTIVEYLRFQSNLWEELKHHKSLNHLSTSSFIAEIFLGQSLFSTIITDLSFNRVCLLNKETVYNKHSKSNRIV